jgi:leucyl aminopeptidase (aminopeptidase T)
MGDDSTRQPNWDALAEQIVDRTLRIAAGERVVYLADPHVCPELLDAVRERVLRARAIDQATILNWTPRLAALRTPSGQALEAATGQQERYAHRDLLNTAGGAVRTVPSPDSARGIIALRREPAWNGAGFPVAQFASHLDIVFQNGRIVELRGGSKRDELDVLRATFAGDWDRLGEVVLGTNPLLTTPAEARMPTYWGFGEGWLRLHLGDNLESGGRFQSEVWTNLFLGTATVTADNTVIVRDGTLLID